MVWYQKRGNKYGAKSTIYNGISYHSKKEAGYAGELDLMIKAGEIESWQRQKRISLDVDDFHICNYYIDFIVCHNDGTIEYVEVKGFETEVWRLKWKLFEALYSNKKNIKLTVIK